MAGGLGVKENVHVEKWAHMREHLELGFKFSKNAGKLAMFGVAVPVLVYAACVGEFRVMDKMAGRSEKKFM
eukprot:CAMPEP_0114236046 /NCGR_PEP_ID=MMETSP0058-20121206/6599_1 /TAXON_ID=36894 /ORGANISM="Pyramimonas parkeae, CCMP726" /LENGTH=70 /DNA_ID=CAMNT_0001347897 /DNA_START=104 /DNA_END=316 /DNA_ORIENTATION=+